MVLEARENAEVIGYQPIGEDIKEAPNVIDYNINQELTTDRSAVFNANNDTTTGMATVIPGVNEPMLLEKTSIVKGREGVGYVSASESHSGSLPDDRSQAFDNLTINDTGGDYTFLSIPNRGILIPVNGYYKIDISYPSRGSSFTRDVYLRGKKGRARVGTILYHQVGSNGETGTITTYLLGGEFVYVYIEATPMSAIATIYPTVSLTITKI